MKDSDMGEMIEAFQNPKTARSAARQMDAGMDSLECSPSAMHWFNRQLEAASEPAADAIKAMFMSGMKTVVPATPKEPSRSPLGTALWQPNSSQFVPGVDPKDVIQRELTELRQLGIELHTLPGMGALAQFTGQSS
jgi:hypothetical protein